MRCKMLIDSIDVGVLPVAVAWIWSHSGRLTVLNQPNESEMNQRDVWLTD